MKDRLITSWSEFLQFSRADAARKGLAFGSFRYLLDPLSRFSFYLRLNEYLLNRRFPLFLRVLPMLVFKRLSVRLGFSVPLNVFGPGLAIVHYGLLVVNSESRIGSNCRVHAGVNIGGGGGYDEWHPGGAPVIGANCYIGPGAKIYGPIRIADNCAIGANAVVNKSFEVEGVTIAGVPARAVAGRGSAGLILGGVSDED